MSNFDKLKKAGALKEVVGALGFDWRKPERIMQEQKDYINSLTSDECLELWSKWKLGGDWWSAMKKIFDQLESE